MHPLPGKFSVLPSAPLRLHLPRPPGARRERGGWGVLPGSPSRWAPTNRVEPGASPRSADRRRGGGGPGGAGTGAQVSRVPTAPVKCSALPLPTTRHQRDKIRRETPAPRRPRSRAPTPPVTRASAPPTPASAPQEARRALLTPHYPRRCRRAPRGPRAPCLPPRPPSEPRPHLCPPPPPPPLARSPRLCRRCSEPHTHRYTQPSDVTESSARPRHCGDTRLPADAAAVSGRPGQSEGGGAGGRGTGPAAAPRPRAGRRLAAPSPSGTRAPSGLLWLPRAPPARRLARAPLPPGARPASPAPRAVWAAGARRCLRCTRRRQDVPSPPHPHRRPPSFLPRVAQPAVWGRHRPAPAPPAARWRRARPGGALVAQPPCDTERGGRAAARCTVRDPSSRQGGGRARPAERRRPRSGTGDPPPAGRSWAAPPRRQPSGGRPASPPPPPAWALRAGAAPRPRGAPPPEGRPASCWRCAPPHTGGPRLARAASAQAPCWG